MDNLWNTAYDLVKSCEDVVIATIISAEGSVPRGSGARMLVTKDGRIKGTVGGGAVEYESINIAKEILDVKENSIRHFILDKNDVEDIGMICGGNVDILFQYVSSKDEKTKEIITALSEAVIKKRPCQLNYSYKEDQSVCMSVLYDDGERLGDTDANTEIYSEQIVKAERVFIFGGGHVAQQLVPILYRCDFDCVIIEDRPEYANGSLFENKCDIILVEEGTLSKNLPNITKDDYVCVMTRAHKDDYLVEAALLKTEAYYIGVMGSRRKIASVNAKLTADGFRESDIQRIITPIGIDICSETPSEIAVSIAAQLIRMRALKKGGKQHG